MITEKYLKIKKSLFKNCKNISANFFVQKFGLQDTIGCYLDLDSKEIFFSKNGPKIFFCWSKTKNSSVFTLFFRKTIRNGVSNTTKTFQFDILSGGRFKSKKHSFSQNFHENFVIFFFNLERRNKF